MRNALVYKLLGRHVNVWQMVGFVLANLCGMTIILTALQLANDVLPMFMAGDGFMKPGQMVVTKRVSALRTLAGSSPTFGDDEIKALREQPFTQRVGLFTPSQFGVFATIGSHRLGMEFSTEMFFESLPASFVDVNPREWQYRAGSDTVPIVLPRNYLNLYNFGFANAQGLPTVSEGLVRQVGVRLRLTGTQGTRLMTGRVVAFSRSINTILVPEDFMREANATLSPDRAPQPSRLIVGVDNPADERIASYLESHGYDTEANDADAARTARFLRLVTTAVVVVGLLICALSFYVLLLSIFLLLQKHTEKIDNLLLMGHSPGSVARPFHALALGLNAVVLVASLALTAWLRQYYLPKFGELYPRFEPASVVPTLLVALALFLLVSVLNHTAIRRKVMAIWRMHG